MDFLGYDGGPCDFNDSFSSNTAFFENSELNWDSGLRLVHWCFCIIRKMSF